MEPLLMQSHLSVAFSRDRAFDPSGLSLYTGPLTEIAQKNGIHYSLHLYADDTQLYVPLYVSLQTQDNKQALERLERCIKDIRKWMKIQFPELNDSKKNKSSVHLRMWQICQKQQSQSGMRQFSPHNLPELKQHVANTVKSCYSQLRAI